MATKKKPMTNKQLRARFERTNKLHVILEIALHDLAKAEKNPKFMVDMCEWCIERDGKCRVCLAGSCMVGIYGKRNIPEWGLFPSRFVKYDQAERKFRALNELRVGDVEAAMNLLGADLAMRRKHQHLYRLMPHYAAEREAWWTAINELLADLKKADI